MTLFRTRAGQKAKILTVSELTAQIQSKLEENFEYVAVSGEVSNAKQSNGHWYFSLKDKDAILPCVCFKGYAQYIRFELQDGLQIVARGKIAVWPPRGAYQMVASTLQPVGIGDWQLAFEQLKEKLEKEGLLALERKRAIPLLPRRIGVVTSPNAAALQDIITALKRRNSKVQLLISPCRVQGEGSAEEIAAAIQDLQSIEDIDVIIVARGGGSIEDLWSFNTEVVARALVSSRIPIISGVGHETDITICDLVADLRAPTPTAAAELVAKGRLELLERWSSLNRRLLHSMEQRVSRTRVALQRLDPRHALLRHAERLKKIAMQVQNNRSRLLSAIDLKIHKLRNRQERGHEKLLALSALNVLKRGFSILQKADESVVSDVKDVEKGEILVARLSSGKLRLKVEEIEND
ncbi:MAG: exodeoxyribonuclease VII large subunit [Candidatus Obscuribacterales bacterium]|nr:exodeoxyribonuclease VII large subunit [Candidatus Obscuribacterales bacterium]